MNILENSNFLVARNKSYSLTITDLMTQDVVEVWGPAYQELLTELRTAVAGAHGESDLDNALRLAVMRGEVVSDG